MEHIDRLFYKLRYLTYGLLMIAGLLMFSLLLSKAVGERTQVKNSQISAGYVSSNMYGSTNAVTDGVFTVTAGLERTLSSTEAALSNSFKSVASAVSHIGSFIVSSSVFIIRGTGHGLAVASRSVVNTIASVGQTLGSGLAFVLSAPFNVVGFFIDTPAASALVRPSADTPIPVIDTPSPVLAKSATPLPTLSPVSQSTLQPANSEATWPIHGDITTHFGVPHWPYQPTHTGIDISDGRSSGVTPIKPFKPGTVIEIVRSYSGLGNYVVIDHGGGLTSLYGHLASISVQKGQVVDKSTTLGMEGSTGASTGTHLHFEIRVNGQPVNPLQYVSGRP